MKAPVRADAKARQFAAFDEPVDRRAMASQVIGDFVERQNFIFQFSTPLYDGHILVTIAGLPPKFFLVLLAFFVAAEFF